MALTSPTAGTIIAATTAASALSDISAKSKAKKKAESAEDVQKKYLETDLIEMPEAYQASEELATAEGEIVERESDLVETGSSNLGQQTASMSSTSIGSAYQQQDTLAGQMGFSSGGVGKLNTAIEKMINETAMKNQSLISQLEGQRIGIEQKEFSIEKSLYDRTAELDERKKQIQQDLELLEV